LKNLQIDRNVVLVVEHLALCRQLVFPVGRQEDQHFSLGGINPIGVLGRGRAPARSPSPESRCGKAVEPHYHPTSVTKEDDGFPISLGFQALTFQSPLGPSDPRWHYGDQIVDGVILADIGWPKGSLSLIAWNRANAAQSSLSCHRSRRRGGLLHAIAAVATPKARRDRGHQWGRIGRSKVRFSRSTASHGFTLSLPARLHVACR
jgi:hypothetical protein